MPQACSEPRIHLIVSCSKTAGPTTASRGTNLAWALSGLAMHWHWINRSVRILITSDRLPRTGKLQQLRITDSIRKDQLIFATIDLPDTRRHTGIMDSVSGTDAALSRLITRSVQTQQTPGQYACTSSETTFAQQLASEALQDDASSLL